MSKYDSRKERAVFNLVFYIQTVWKAAGLKWDYDNEAEVAEIVDAILDAAKEGAK